MLLKDISGGRQVIRAAAICFTDSGQKAAEKVPGLSVCRFGRDFTDTRCLTRRLMTGSGRMSAVIFFSSAGIAVRMTAPYIVDKMIDPAVLVINDTADYVIPLLSGHAGRANQLAVSLSEILDAQPVITTASDQRKGMEVPDLWAMREGYTIHSRKDVKSLTAAMLEGRKVERIHSCGDVIWRVAENGRYSDTKTAAEIPSVRMSPRKYIIGIGCRKGISADDLRRFAEGKLGIAGIHREQIFKICSIDIKSEEAAILELAQAWNRPYVVFSAQHLNQLSGSFSSSPFVEGITGTDNVCERSAIAGCAPWGGKLLIRKTAEDGMTIAVAERTLVTSRSDTEIQALPKHFDD